MRTRTKIICTIGPATSSYETILELIDAGMNVARVNFSHGTHADHKKTIDLLKRARDEKQVPLAIMLDTKGPEIRVGVLKDPIEVKKGEKKLLTRDDTGIPINPPIALDPLKKGDFVLFDDGYIGSEVVNITEKGVEVAFLNEGVIKSQKGVNMPHVDVPLPAMTKQDIEDIQFGAKEDIDLIAASFIRSAAHVREIKALLYELKRPEVLVIAKIENAKGVENFDSIVQVADGIMVARGDLGVELPIEEVPVLQKMMIRKCVEASKPVVTATQMLESMISSPRPTRAEASDVANAIYDSTSCVMLSGETAVGKYPVHTVKLMRLIIEAAEADFPFADFFEKDAHLDTHDTSSSISQAAVKTAYSLGAKAIFAFTSSGSTARLISRFRPPMPIVALTPSLKTYNQLAFNWGVHPVEPAHTATPAEALAITSSYARENDIVQFGDLVVVISGAPFGVSGTTNSIVVESIGEVLVRAHESEGPKTQGEILIVLTPDDYNIKRAREKIIVLPKYDETYRPILEKAKALILQNHPDDLDSEHLATIAAKELSIPILVRADEAIKRLQDGWFVTLDPKKGTVYKKNPSSEEEESFGISDPRD